MNARRPGQITALVAIVMVGSASCGRVKTPAPAAKVEAAPVVASQPEAAKFVMPDYAAQAKAQTADERRSELRAKVEALRVEMPARKTGK